ncbi:MAG: winged helix-turn-helix domain-containing protein [Hyphomonas sp.]|uniref:winged helix-turn-helix domain-containing tetratricopeptide repeat protein n=1 Tax=Hyphomonas sp. TaxID=87 RepID=UPI0035271405
MIFLFEDFELDSAKFELRRGGERIAAEPQVLSLLLLLAENNDRLVSKDEIVEKIWDGRAISDAALSSRIKSARQLLDDDGKAQRLIRTVHGRGFRFAVVPQIRRVALPVTVSEPEHARSDLLPDADAPHAGATKPSIAILPFRLVGVAGAYAPLAEALPHDLITSLSRLRWLFVIARGSSFRFRGIDPDLAQIRSVLGVAYCLSGVIEIVGTRMAVSVELADTRTGGVIWSERYAGDVGNIHEVREQIVAHIVSELDVHIPLHEAGKARLVPTEHLDAWSAYHLGLTHMFRFTRRDNEQAGILFTHALSKDPGFARALAGLSFTRFQNAFLRYTPDIAAEITGARDAAERAMANDPLDPFCNLVMGRTHWIEKDLEGSSSWLDRAVQLNPNYAQAVYLRGLTQTMIGNSETADPDLGLAMKLSPLDPLHYAMMSTRGISLMLRGKHEDSIQWAERAARAPGAHAHIALVAAAAQKIAGHDAPARRWVESARQRAPNISTEAFLEAFPFADPDQRALIENALKSLGA